MSQLRARSHFDSTRGEGAGVALEEGDVRAVAADRDLDGERAAPGERGQCLAHQRRLAVAPRRDQKDLLAGAEVGDQAVELDRAVGERLARHDLAVDERVVHAATASAVTFNGVTVTLMNVTEEGGQGAAAVRRSEGRGADGPGCAILRGPGSGSCPV